MENRDGERNGEGQVKRTCGPAEMNNKIVKTQRMEKDELEQKRNNLEMRKNRTEKKRAKEDG